MGKQGKWAVALMVLVLSISTGPAMPMAQGHHTAEPATLAGQRDALAHTLSMISIAHNRNTPAVDTLADLADRDPEWRREYIRSVTRMFAGIAHSRNMVSHGNCYMESALDIDQAVARLMANDEIRASIGQLDAVSTLRRYCLPDETLQSLMRR